MGVSRALLMARADANAKDHNSFSPLYLAAQNGHTQVVLDLMAAGADPNIKTSRVSLVFRQTSIDKLVLY